MIKNYEDLRWKLFNSKHSRYFVETGLNTNCSVCFIVLNYFCSAFDIGKNIFGVFKALY